MSEASLPNMNQTLAGSRVQGPAPAVLGGDVRASRPRARVVHRLCSACCKGASLCFLAVLPQHLSCSLLLSNKGHVMAGRWASCTVWFTGRNQPHFRHHLRKPPLWPSYSGTGKGNAAKFAAPRPKYYCGPFELRILPWGKLVLKESRGQHRLGMAWDQRLRFSIRLSSRVRLSYEDSVAFVFPTDQQLTSGAGEHGKSSCKASGTAQFLVFVLSR